MPRHVACVSRFTLDYGVRFTHNGSMYDERNYNSGFVEPVPGEPEADPVQPYCSTLVAGNVTAQTANRFAINRLNKRDRVQAFSGTVVPGSGSDHERHVHRRRAGQRTASMTP